jgi:polyisoprenoid-binding protein YceI
MPNMKRLKNIVLLGFMLVSFLCSAQDSYVLANDYTVKILGTSNLHNWDETVGTISGYGVVNWNSDGSFDVDAIKMVMDVNSIKGESSIMNNKTYKALKADTNPKITFTLRAPVKAVKADPGGTMVSATGTLTIAGITKTINMKVTIISLTKGKLIMQGSQVIKMTDYGIIPPTALFGTLKTGDEITLDFKTTFLLNG